MNMFMKVKEILDYENNLLRDRKCAYIFIDNDWIRAYEWSAYLIYNLIDDDEEKLKPFLKKSSLLADGLITVGFKKESIEKYLCDKSNGLLLNGEYAIIFIDDKYNLSEE